MAILLIWGLPRLRSIIMSIVVMCALIVASGCDACNSVLYPGTREPEYKLGPGNILTPRARIPERLRANCDICPYWCTQLDLRPMPISMLIRNYRRAARDYDGDDGDRRADGWEALEGFACIVKGSDSAVMREQFLKFLHDDNIVVRYAAAVHAIRYDLDVPTAVQVLREMAVGDDPMSAQIVLWDWEIGNEVELH